MKGDKNDEELFQLPDGHTIAIGPERKQAPEILFNPMLIGQEYMGVHQMLVSTIARCDLDIRRAMFSDIILAGGSTMFEGRLCSAAARSPRLMTASLQASETAC